MSLSESEYIKNIASRIEQSGIEDESLKIDLMDHICCLIEEKVTCGMAFERAFEEAMGIFKTSKLAAIKEETEFLTKSNIIMKKRTIIIGIVAVVIILAGIILKVNHMTGANITLILGWATLAFGFVLSSLFDRFQYINDTVTKWWHLIGHSGLIILIVGIALKILHQPGGNIAVGVGVIMLALGFLVISSSKNFIKV